MQTKLVGTATAVLESIVLLLSLTKEIQTDRVRKRERERERERAQRRKQRGKKGVSEKQKKRKKKEGTGCCNFNATTQLSEDKLSTLPHLASICFLP